MAMNRRHALRALVASAGAIATSRSVRVFAAEPAIVSTTAGKIKGFVDANGVLGFKGVPYGADSSSYRFRPPVPVKPWTGVRDALEFGAIAPQPGMRGRVMTEDCLHLNVWTPGVRGTRPVMVWFHPGGYSSGTSNETEADGARLSRRGDVVVVTVNHRINAFGHLYLAEFLGEEYADSGNVGILDLILALKWVRDNIGQFGGDPGLVTIFGQSGGGAKSATLMAMPEAHGLFHRVITMSGQQITASRMSMATMHATQLIDALHLSRDRVRDLVTMPTTQIVAASRSAAYYGPVKDGRSLPRDPFDPDSPPLSASIPMILGNTLGETRTLIGLGNASLFDLTWDRLRPVLEENSPFMGLLDRGMVIASYRKWYPNYSPADVFFQATTDSRSWRGQVIEAERRAMQSEAAPRTWVYQFNWRTPVEGGKWGAHHGLDVPFAFDSVQLVPEKVGPIAGAKALAAQMSDAFIAFARSGNPNHSGLPQWPVYDLTMRSTMIFDALSRTAPDPRGDARRLFAQVPYVQPGT